MGNIVNRVFDSSGPEGKVRGTPQQIIDKYNQLTRDAQLSNDRVAAENFQQHAEHYARMLGEAQREQEAKKAEQEAQQQQAREAREARQAEASAEKGDRGGKPDKAEPSQKADRQESGSDQKSFDAVIDVSGNEESGLVETPESAPKPKPKRRRSPKKTGEAKAASSDGTGDQPDGPSSEGSQAAE